MRHARMCFLRLNVGLIFLFISSISDAITPTDAEVAMLPDYCQAKVAALRGNHMAAKPWEQQFGVNNFMVINHYCMGLVQLRRARSAFGAEKGKRALYLQDAGNDFMYVIKAWPKDFVLQADAHYWSGKVSQVGGNDVKAAGFFSQAINLRPDFVQAYSALADLWMNRGEKAKAREVLEQGLKSTSNAEPLVRQMAQLEAGGAGSRPVPAGGTLPGRTTTGQGSAKKP